MATEFKTFSDDRQLLVLDRDSQTELADYWSRFDSPVHNHLALAEDGVSIYTGLNGDVTVAVDVVDRPPVDDRDAFAQVVECSVRIDSGVLVVTCTTYGEGDGDPVEVPAGWLRLRISLTNEPYEEDVEEQHIRIQCWSAEPADPVLIKAWDPDAGQDVSA
jgi:hypothetical protein